MATEKTLSLKQIRTDGGTQIRAEINEAVVKEYSQALKNEEKFPPVQVFFDGATYWLADGFHRYWAHKEAEIANIQASITDGSQRDAIMCATAANCGHGLQRTNGDKRKAVMTLCEDLTWQKWSDVRIATHCRVSVKLVRDVRKLIVPPSRPIPNKSGIEEEGVRVAKRGQREYPIDTSSLGPKTTYSPFDNLEKLVGSMIRATDEIGECPNYAKTMELLRELLEQVKVWRAAA